MRVKYQTRVVRKTFSTNGGTESERVQFMKDILLALADMGAPLNLEDVVIFDNQVGASFLGESNSIENGPAACMFLIDNSGSGTSRLFYLSGCGADPEFSNYFDSCTEISYGTSTSKNASVIIHAVKSGDSFFFGFLPYNNNPSEGCINYAITPMRRLSDPSVSLGYALLQGATISDAPAAFIGRTLPYIEGFNYNDGFYNQYFSYPTFFCPEVDTGKIPLIPHYAGVEDIYYDRVYLSPMRRGYTEEKAFETNMGVFLISGELPIDVPCCTFAFDITEAVNSAQ